jgi:hypothetical protein
MVRLSGRQEGNSGVMCDATKIMFFDFGLSSLVRFFRFHEIPVFVVEIFRLTESN